MSTPAESDANVPLVGIALAAYRPEPEYFRQQLESIATQLFSNWFCVITLDSPTSELTAATAIATYLTDSRFIWLENPERLGHKRNFERAIAAAAERGAAAIATCDQDDIWYPEKLQVLVDALAAAGDGSLVHSDMHLLRDDSSDGPTLWTYTHRVVEDAQCWQMLVSNAVTGCSMMFDAELARRFPRIPVSFDYHDHWYAFVASCAGRVLAVKQVLGAYRQHGENVIGANEFAWAMSARILTRVIDEIRASRDRWLRLIERYDDALREGVSMSLSTQRLLLSRDLGFGLAYQGARLFLRDPRLARLCFRNAIGKFVCFVRPTGGTT